MTSKTTCHENVEAEIHARMAEIGVAGILSESELIQRSRSWGGCDVYRWRLPSGHECLVKSLQNRPFWVRLLYGSRTLKAEDANLRMLRDHGVRVPQPYGMADKNNLLEEYLGDGKVLLSLRHYTEKTKPPREFFQRLSDMIMSMHDNGICHGDFHRANVMILGDGEPCLLDVATAMHVTETSSWLDKLLFGMFRRADVFSLARIVESFYPEMIDVRLAEALKKAPWYLRIGRFLRHRIYRRIRGKRKRASAQID